MKEQRRSPVTVARLWARSNVVTVVLIVFILLSTLLNALMLGAIYRIREVVRAHITTAVDQIAEARRQTIEYDFPIDQSFPISTTIQLNETLDVPIDMSVPIKQNLSVPVEVPIVGRVDLPVNLDFAVPISTTVQVAVNKQIPIETNVDLDTDIPLEIPLGEPPLGDVLRRLEEALRQLLEQL